MAALVMAEGAARLGVFEALGSALARGADRHPGRLYLRVVVAAVVTTVGLSLDATVVLLLPVALVAAARTRVAARPSAFVLGHLANSASLLLPFANLTNLIVVAAAGVGAARYLELMAGPTALAVAIDVIGVAWIFRGDLRPGRGAVVGSPESGAGEAVASPGSGAGVAMASPERAAGEAASPVAGARTAEPARVHGRTGLATGVIGLTLVAFLAASELRVAVVWAALPAAVLLAALARMRPGAIVRAAQPQVALAVLVVGLLVAGARSLGAAGAVDQLLGDGDGLTTLLRISIAAALVAGVVNNLPAVLLLLPTAEHLGTPALLAMLIGVNVGPNLLPGGSLATILWWRVARSHGERVAPGDFARAGLVTVPATLVLGTLALWLAAGSP